MTYLRATYEPGMWRLFGGPRWGSLLDITWPWPKFVTRGHRAGGHWYFGWKPLALEIGHYDDNPFHLHISAVVVQVFIHLPFRPKTPLPIGEMGRAWGFSTHHGIHLHWGLKTKVVLLPWRWEHHRTEWQCADGTWWTEPRGRWSEMQEEREAADLLTLDLPYHYCLKSWEVQKRTATVRVMRMTWKRLCLPFWKRTATSIDVQFDDEVGEGTGSWKGGTVGCGYTMRKNETPTECLRRMERERTFD